MIICSSGAKRILSVAYLIGTVVLVRSSVNSKFVKIFARAIFISSIANLKMRNYNFYHLLFHFRLTSFQCISWDLLKIKIYKLFCINDSITKRVEREITYLRRMVKMHTDVVSRPVQEQNDQGRISVVLGK